MAVITRKGLQTEQANKIKDKAIAQASVYNPVFSQLQQQRTILSGQQQNLIQTAQNTLGDVGQNIYQAQRQARAAGAAAGMIGDVESTRAATELQDQIGYELGNIVKQANQGTISIASQQSAINEAEVMNAQNEILDIYADELIASEDSSISLDVGAQWSAGLGAAFAGGLAGLGVGSLAPKIGTMAGKSTFKGVAAGAATGFISATAVNQAIGIAQNYWTEDEREGFAESEWGQRGSQWTALAGGAAGAAYGRYSKAKTAFAAKNGIEAVKKNSGAWTTGMRKNPKKFKAFNPTPLGLTLAGIGAVTGGLSAGLRKKYKLDYDSLLKSDTAKDFKNMGIDLEALSGIIKNK